MRNELTVTGIDELILRLEQLGEQTEAIKEKALEAGAEIIQAEIERNAPRSSINHEHMADGIFTHIVNEMAIIGPSAEFYYAHFLEFGTKKMAAKPFMGPAFESKKEAAKDKMAEVIKEVLGL